MMTVETVAVAAQAAHCKVVELLILRPGIPPLASS